MFFPWLFSTDCRCDCADKVIDYLENEKYKWVPRKLTQKQRAEAVKLYNDSVKVIDNNPFRSDYGKVLQREQLYKQTFYKKVLK